MRRVLAWAAALSLLMTAVPQVVSPALASQTCSGYQSNYFDGFDTRTITTYGAYAYISTKVGALCTGSGQGASAAWTMVGGNYNSSTDGYAQSGYAAITGHSTARYFSQWVQTLSGVPVTVWGGSASGSVLYLTTYDFGAGRLKMYVGSTVYDTTNFDPALVWSAPWDSQYFGETWEPQDDMPGVAATHAQLTNIRYVANRSSGWVSVPSGTWVITGSSRYHQTQNLDHFDIWTDPLT